MAMSSLVGVFMIVMGAGIAGIWTVDIVRSPEVDRTRGIVRARDRSNGSLLVPHWMAEYATALVLLDAGIGLVVATAPGAWSWLVPIGLGALAYTSLNSLGWVLADRSRAAYGIPMVAGLIGAIASVGMLFAGSLLALPAV
ncbi:MAG TPA: hypothetical protein VIV06_00595 [Candidatus Limnocylindrales bacterium]